MKLGNKQITLRALEPNDVELLYQWENDTRVWRVSNTHAPLSKFILANYIKSTNNDIWESKQLRLVIENEYQIPVGTVELFDFDPYHGRAGVGIMIFDDSEKRKGLASQTLDIIIEYSLVELGLNQLYANIAASNTASMQLFKKVGFEITGVKKQWLRTPTGWDDENLLQKKL
ncbi:MAG TPA: GNAT family N-acetyltransferase [Prolixibacteraceae bacterium]|nr:GNAT family N-acetyltransferase [Prolixibacteraceae bacterium]